MPVAVEQQLNNGRFSFLRTRESYEAGLMNITVLNYDTAECFDTRDQMEQFCLNYILEHSPQAENVLLEEYRDPKDIQFVLNKAANLPAINTRRGRATRLFYGNPTDPGVVQLLMMHKLSAMNALILEHNPTIPADALILMYQGINSLDQAFGYAMKDARYHLSFDEKSHLYATIIPI